MTALIGGTDWMPPSGASTQIIQSVAISLNSVGPTTQQIDITSLLQPQYSAIALYWLWDNVSPVGAIAVSINATGLGAQSSKMRLPTLLQDGQNTTSQVVASLITSTAGAALIVRVDQPTGSVGTTVGQLVIVGISQPALTIVQVGQVFQPVFEATGNITVASLTSSVVLLKPPTGTYQRIKQMFYVGATAPVAGTALQFVDVSTGLALWTIRTTGVANQADAKPCDIINLGGIQFSNNSSQSFIFGAVTEQYPA